MRRSHLIAFVTGAVLVATVWMMNALPQPAEAQVKQAVAGNVYKPTFKQWATVWMKANLEDISRMGIMSVATDRTSRGIRWTYKCSYNAATRSGKAYHEMFESRCEILKEQLKAWRKQGFDIRNTDVIITADGSWNDPGRLDVEQSR